MNRAAKRRQEKLARKAAGQNPQTVGRATPGAPMDKHLELIQKGMKLHQDGQLQEAAAIYRRVLQINPDHADANHLLGVLVSRLGSPLEAVDLISKAIGIAPKQPIYHNNLGNVLRDLGRSDAALASYGRALALKPDYAGAHYNLGKVLRELGRLDDALAG
jgi:tetratricopeptide (TPR) repeat protein